MLTKMNIKQALSKIDYYYSCYLQGYSPTLGEVENYRVKNLAGRLKAGSYEETLTNILEWQERNIEFWAERHPILTLLFYIYCRIFPAFVFLTFIGPLLGIVLIQELGIQTVALVWFVQIVVWFIENVLWFFLLLASIAIVLVATMISILHSNRKFLWKEIPKGLWNVFAPTISINFLLEKKLGVCRDYAKLTACLLSNIYPNAEIYFASAPSHMATGISVNNRLYMLDQRLPILTIDRWKDYRKHRKRDYVEKFDSVKMTLQKADKRAFSQTKDKSELNTEKLTKRMVNLLNIKEKPDHKAILPNKSVQIPWKKGVILYEEDELVNYSLARRLKAKISNELVELDQIIGIEIERHKDDLIFLIRFSS